MILYCPDASVVADRTLSISAGLLASTVTPGNTAPDASFTVPAMVLVCADATIGQSVSHATPTMIREANVRIPILPPQRLMTGSSGAQVVRSVCLQSSFVLGRLTDRSVRSVSIALRGFRDNGIH